MKRFALVALATACLVLSAPLSARDIQTFEKNIPADAGLKEISLEADIEVAELSITTHQAGDILNAEVRYDAERIDVDVEYTASGSTADIRVSSDKFSRRFKQDTDDCRWDLSLSRDYVWDLDLDIGFAEGELNFSGLPLARFGLEIGAAEGRVVFDEPNPERLSRFTIDAGAGELEFLGLGFANFEHLSFNGGAGEFVLDFDGLTDGLRTAEIDIGVGEVRIELPDGLPVRIESNDSWFNTIKIRGVDLDEVDDGIFETEGFDNADFGLEITLDVGIGSATIGWTDGGEFQISSRHGTRDIDHEWSSHEAWGHLPPLPVLPDLPPLPDIPPLPAIADIPALPPIPELPEIPPLPPVPPIPEIPALVEPIELPELPEIPPLPPVPPIPERRRIQE